MTRRVRSAFVSLLLAAAGVVACAGGAERPILEIATTTSVQNSGLLDALLPHFPDAVVRVHAAGSGRSLEMLADGLVDLVISHAPETEQRYLTDHPGWAYRKLAYNHFIIVGPAADPARIGEAADALEAFRRIANAPVTFVSRGDQSGTHERELALWRDAGAAPPPDRLLRSGRSMATALWHADERQSYTLSDEATFRQLEEQLDLEMLFADDPRLLNTYAVVHRRGQSTAESFAEWLTRGDGRERIAAYRVQGRLAFTIWPSGCPDHTPDLPPCPAN